jgi:hypothetical protein
MRTKILVENPEGKRRLARPSTAGRIILKWTVVREWGSVDWIHPVTIQTYGELL